MKTHQTSATVNGLGHVHVSGVPFSPGTEVEITIKPAQTGGDPTASATDRTARLFAALDKARNTEPIRPLRREELYDRKVFVDSNVQVRHL